MTRTQTTLPNLQRAFGCAFLALLVSGLLSPSIAQAAFIGSDLVVITMTDDAGNSASRGIANPFANLPPQAQVPDFVREMIHERFALSDGDNVLGYIDSMGANLIGDPVASISFSVTAGASDVTVSVSSATVSFPTLTNPAASSKAEVTLTDNNSGDGPATIDTVGANAGLYRAIYNGSSQYSAHLGDSSVGGGSVLFSEDTSGPVAGNVSSIQSRFDFKLSAGDTAVGTGTFTVVIPEPTTLGLLACGILALAAANRRQ